MMQMIFTAGLRMILDCFGRSAVRLFIAVEPSPAFRAALSALQQQLAAAGVTGQWLTPENFHLTLAFIGEWPEECPPPLPPPGAPFPIALSHPGVFQRAKVLYAGIAPSAELTALAERTQSCLTEAGIPFDSKPFVPHITLARKPSVPPGLLLPEFPVPPARMEVRGACLYRSQREESGMAYTVIRRSLTPEKGS